jgi:hypothetical protein
MTSYTVIFDGTDRGVMGRLLCALAPVPVSEPLTRTLPPDVKPNRRGEAITVLRNMPEAQSGAWFTVQEAQRGTSLELEHFRNAVQYLRRRGEVVRERKIHGQSRPAHYQQRYRWIA